mmetsp:Transcript_4689/g.29573  ORF Transcript_4689/g.29573 Transcript_4689/m.29573 type:complete len:239 (+) Transcript_4689:436-1152(+)
MAVRCSGSRRDQFWSWRGILLAHTVRICARGSDLAEANDRQVHPQQTQWVESGTNRLEERRSPGALSRVWSFCGHVCTQQCHMVGVLWRLSTARLEVRFPSRAFNPQRRRYPERRAKTEKQPGQGTGHVWDHGRMHCSFLHESPGRRQDPIAGVPARRSRQKTTCEKGASGRPSRQWGTRPVQRSSAKDDVYEFVGDLYGLCLRTHQAYEYNTGASSARNRQLSIGMGTCAPLAAIVN